MRLRKIKLVISFQCYRVKENIILEEIQCHATRYINDENYFNPFEYSFRVMYFNMRRKDENKKDMSIMPFLYAFINC